MNTKPIIVALDIAEPATALNLAARLDPTLCRVKVGKELFTAGGPQVVDALMYQGFEVFLDLKFHDIPNTVASACRVAASQGVWMLNVHASGGNKMLHAAREAIDAVPGHQPLLIGVTVLTSLTAEEAREIYGMGSDVPSLVLKMAQQCAEAKLDGVVCSAEEAAMLRASMDPHFKLVTPGIRLADDAKGDQARVVTPVDAIKMGSDYLVIGRSITAAADPVMALKGIMESLRKI